LLHSLEARVAQTIRRQALAGPADRITIAVSGGADSVALAWVLHELAAAGRLVGGLAGFVHVNHRLRGAESDGDERFCRELAARLGLPIEVATFDAAAEARRRRRSVEGVARDLRYGFFASAAGRLGATLIATAHTIDDQAETVLLRLLRGAGGRGAAGIAPRRGNVIRPLLECRRAQVRAYLEDRGEPFREDSSNRDESIARNRVRHRLLPVIEQMSPGGVRALARFAALAAEDEAYLNRAAIEAASFVVLSSDGGVELDVDALNTLPAALARRVLRRMAEAAGSGIALGARHFEAVRTLASADKPRGHLDLPRLTVRRRGSRLSMRATGGRASADTAGREPYERPLAVPGVVAVPEAGLSIAAAWHEGGDETASGRGDRAVVPAASIVLPLSVRNRRTGDRFRPLGAPGRRKLQDVLVDRKVARHERDRLPLVVDAEGRIVWVVGLTVAESCRVTSPGGSMVVLNVTRFEEGAE